MTFDMLVMTAPEERLERDEMFAQCTSQQELGSVHFQFHFYNRPLAWPNLTMINYIISFTVATMMLLLRYLK